MTKYPAYGALSRFMYMEYYSSNFILGTGSYVHAYLLPTCFLTILTKGLYRRPLRSLEIVISTSSIFIQIFFSHFIFTRSSSPPYLMKLPWAVYQHLHGRSFWNLGNIFGSWCQTPNKRQLLHVSGHLRLNRDSLARQYPTPNRFSLDWN
jgi:hypothetical protein